MNDEKSVPESPKLRALAQALARGEAGALDAFWHEVAATGTPLVEASEADQRLLVTFLWRAAHPHSFVV